MTELISMLSDLRADVEACDRDNKDHMLSLLDRADLWVNDPEAAKAARVEHIAAQYTKVEAPCGDSTNAENCTCPDGTVCLRKALYMLHAGSTDEDLANHKLLKPIVGYSNAPITEYMQLKEIKDIIDTIKILLHLEEPE